MCDDVESRVNDWEGRSRRGWLMDLEMLATQRTIQAPVASPSFFCSVRALRCTALYVTLSDHLKQDLAELPPRQRWKLHNVSGN